MPKQGYISIGKMQMRKFYNVELALSGAVEAVAAFLIPPYVIPKRYWLNMRIGSKEGTTPFPPNFFIDYKLDGRVLPLPTNLNADATAHDTMQEYMNEFATHGDNSQPFNEQTGVQAAYDKIGTSEEVTKPSGLFFTREKSLGLPGNALFSSSDSLYLFDHIITKGKFPYDVKSPEEGSLLVFQAWTDEPAGGSTELVNLIGSSVGSRTLNDLSAEILNHFSNESLRAPLIDTVDVDQEMMNWLSSGLILDALPVMTGDERIVFSTWLSIEFDVQVPAAGRNRVSAPG